LAQRSCATHAAHAGARQRRSRTRRKSARNQRGVSSWRGSGGMWRQRRRGGSENGRARRRHRKAASKNEETNMKINNRRRHRKPSSKIGENIGGTMVKHRKREKIGGGNRAEKKSAWHGSESGNGIEK
jgi:hypothetical protein